MNDTSLEDVTHEEAVATLKKTQDRVVIVIARVDFTDSAAGPPPRYQDAVKSSKLYNTILNKSSQHHCLANLCLHNHEANG